jgi:hypothetical protein
VSPATESEDVEIDEKAVERWLETKLRSYSDEEKPLFLFAVGDWLRRQFNKRWMRMTGDEVWRGPKRKTPTFSPNGDVSDQSTKPIIIDVTDRSFVTSNPK